MVPRSTFFRRSSAVVAASVALVLPACGGGEAAFGKRYPVSGEVTYNGKPLEKGTISFIPRASGNFVVDA